MRPQNRPAVKRAKVLVMSGQRVEPYNIRDLAVATTLGNPSAKGLLVAIALHANRDGVAFMNRDTLLAETELDERTVQRVVKCMQLIGLLEWRRISKAEQRASGEDFKEEYRLRMDRLANDLCEEFQAAYKADSGKAPPRRKPCVRVRETENHVAETRKSVSETFPPDPLYGRTSQEHLTEPQSSLREQKGKLESLEEASTRIVDACCLSKILARRQWPVVHEALERICVEAKRCPADVADEVIPRWAAAVLAGSRQGLGVWLAGGHWQHEPGFSKPPWRTSSATLGMYSAEGDGSGRDPANERDEYASFIRESADVLAKAVVSGTAAAVLATTVERLRMLAADVLAGQRTLCETEDVLHQCDLDILAALQASASKERWEGLQEEAALQLKPYVGRLASSQLEAVRDSWVQKRLAEAAGVPRLSVAFMARAA